MKRGLFAVVAGTLLVAGGTAFAQLHQAGHADGETVKPLSVTEIPQKLDGKESSVTMLEVTIGPGQQGLPHRHPGPAFVYVLEGEYELGVDDQPTKRFKAGETFYEPAGALHRVSRNPATEGKTRLIAVIVHPRDAGDIAVIEK